MVLTSKDGFGLRAVLTLKTNKKWRAGLYILNYVSRKLVFHA